MSRGSGGINRTSVLTGRDGERLRGFNLLYFFSERSAVEPDERDFADIAEWGFNFVRLPMNYRQWASREDPWRIDPVFWERMDAVVTMAERYALHLCLNFHRAPGYCINSQAPDPFNLWRDTEALDCFLHHWRFVADRYRGADSDRLSLNPVNEPPATFRPGETVTGDGMSNQPAVPRADLVRVYRAVIEAVREIDPLRTVIIDGSRVGNDPVPEIDLPGVIQSCRGYMPFGLTHYRAEWPAYTPDVLPDWPFRERDGEVWDSARLEARFAPWADLLRAGTPVHCGEWGVYKHTPHKVALAWMESFLDLLKRHGAGWSLWNFTGPFGIVTSGRKDVTYETLGGRPVDRAMLEVLRRH